MKKGTIMMAMAFLLSVANAGTVLAGWQQDAVGWWYQKEDGSYPASSLEQIDGQTYFFDNNGYMVTGWKTVGDYIYYFDASGARLTGWQQLGGSWYYLNPSTGGGRHIGWLNLDGKRYYMDSNGIMQTGVFFLDMGESGSRYAYYADPSGALITNTTASQGTSRLQIDSEGRIKYRNSKTERDAERYGTDVWQWLLSQEQLDAEADSEEGVRREIEDALYDSYKKNVKKARKAERAEALHEWKEEARSELEGYMTSAEIEAFINKVAVD